MNRIGRITLAVAGALTLGLASVTQAQVVMRNSVSIAQNSHQGNGIDVLSQEVEKGTNGRIIIKNFFAGSLGISEEEAAEYLATFEGSCQSACWFWEQNNLNRFADAGDIRGLTRAINGGYIGLEDRIKHYEHALHVMGV